MSLEVSQKDAVAVMKELGYKAAPDWSLKMLQKKVDKLPETQAEGKCSSDEAQQIFDAILDELDGGGSVVVKESKKKAAGKTTKGKPDKEKAHEGNGKTATKKNTPKAKADGKKPGVVDFIIGLLKKASEKKALTKEELASKCKEKFPDRDLDAMKKTVTNQVSYFIKATHNLDLRSKRLTDSMVRAYWIKS